MSTAFDMRLVQCGARLRRSPFFEATQRYGAKAYTVYNHMLFPICFGDLEEEYWHLIHHVTLGRGGGAAGGDHGARRVRLH